MFFNLKFDAHAGLDIKKSQIKCEEISKLESVSYVTEALKEVKVAGISPTTDCPDKSTHPSANSNSSNSQPNDELKEYIPFVQSLPKSKDPKRNEGPLKEDAILTLERLKKSCVHLDMLTQQTLSLVSILDLFKHIHENREKWTKPAQESKEKLIGVNYQVKGMRDYESFFWLETDQLGHVYIFHNATKPLLGEGAAKKVYGTIMYPTGTPIAQIRLLNPLDRDAARAFRNESEFILGLSKEKKEKRTHLARAYTFAETSTGHALYLKKMNSSLHQELVQNPNDWKESTEKVGSLTAKVAAAIETFHHLGRIHADVKPENVMLDKRRDPVLIDYDLSYDMEEAWKKKARPFGGTPGYQAPEVWLEPFIQGGELTPERRKRIQAQDVFSLGVLAYEVYFGHVLSEASAPMGDFDSIPPSRGKIKQLQDQIRKPKSGETPANQALREIIARCLEYDPDQRPTPQEVYDTLAKYPEFRLKQQK